MKKIQKLLFTAAALIIAGSFACKKEKPVGESRKTVNGTKFIIKKGAAPFYTIKGKDNKWKVNIAALNGKIKRKNGGYTITVGSEKFKIKSKDNKYKLYNPNGSLKYKIKFKGNDIKIYRGEKDNNPLSIKVKEEGVKLSVKKGDKKIGKIKFYRDKNKIKVKDLNDKEVCSAKYGQLISSPGVCLFNDLNDRDKLLLFSLLYLIGK